MAVPGVVIETAGAKRTGEWTYAYQTADGPWSGGLPGVRIKLPYRADGVAAGEVQVDFSYDEWLPERPVWTRIPRTGGGDGPEIVLRAVGPELALAWKRHWLERDRREEGGSRPKDGYDVELLDRLLSSLPDWW